MPLDDLRAWIGRSQTVEDFLAPWPAKALIATLDEHDPEPRMGDPLPPLWHWLYFLEAAPASKIGPDGHGERGDFLPPIDLPRRMWAGSRFSFDGEPLRLGDTARRVSTIKSIEPKTRIERVDGVRDGAAHAVRPEGRRAASRSTTSSIARPPSRARQRASPSLRRPMPPPPRRSCPIRCCCSASRR